MTLVIAHSQYTNTDDCKKNVLLLEACQDVLMKSHLFTSWSSIAVAITMLIDSSPGGWKPEMKVSARLIYTSNPSRLLVATHNLPELLPVLCPSLDCDPQKGSKDRSWILPVKSLKLSLKILAFVA